MYLLKIFNVSVSYGKSFWEFADLDYKKFSLNKLIKNGIRERV